MKYLLLAVFLGCLVCNCRPPGCPEAGYYENAPGVCGKFNRLEKAKQRYAKYAFSAIVIMLGLVFAPVLIQLSLKLLRIFLFYLFRLLDRFR